MPEPTSPRSLPSRRELLQRSGLGLGALGLAGLLGDTATAAGPLAPKPALAKYAGKPLPETLRTERKTGGALPSSFKFQKYGQSGIEVSELFAETARHIDDVAVIRSMKAQVPNHEPSLMLMNCGDSAQPRPSVGAWVLYGLGAENQNLPGFVAMCPGGHPIKGAENWQSGFLPGAFQGTFVDPKHDRIDKLIENIAHPHATTAAQR